ncbi:MAG TPA: hypothetical protein P5244_11045 [Syntrophales bacterium]|nr:hypothetical protein [Syntrophales bacterium]
MGNIKATGTTRITCGDCGKSTEFDISSMDFRKKDSTSIDAEEFEASADIKCSFCQSGIPYHLTARRNLPDGPVNFSCSKVGATSDPTDVINFRLKKT